MNDKIEVKRHARVAEGIEFMRHWAAVRDRLPHALTKTVPEGDFDIEARVHEDRAVTVTIKRLHGDREITVTATQRPVPQEED